MLQRRSMNVAIPTLEDRVSPVFDVAQAVMLVQLRCGRELRRDTVPLHAPDIARRAAELSQHDVDVLICGAVSRPLEATLRTAGIHVIPRTCGPIDEVLRAFVAGRLNDRAFLMPGCCGWRRRDRGQGRRRGRHGRQAEEQRAERDRR
jgi:predicted Fe-Mo cluster-binding NifX family protein